MKKVLSVVFVLLLGVSVSIAQEKTSAVKFDQMVYDFGEVEYQSDVSHSFTFKNVSKTPVSITNVGTSCGCTTPAYSKEPVAAGKKGSVTAKYDSSRIGAFTKTLTVSFNNGETVTLTIRGTIKPPAPQAPQGN